MTAIDLVDVADSDLDGVTGAHGRSHHHKRHHSWRSHHHWRDGGWRTTGPALGSSVAAPDAGAWLNMFAFAGVAANFVQQVAFQGSAQPPPPHFDKQGVVI